MAEKKEDSVVESNELSGGLVALAVVASIATIIILVFFVFQLVSFLLIWHNAKELYTIMFSSVVCRWRRRFWCLYAPPRATGLNIKKIHV